MTTKKTKTKYFAVLSHRNIVVWGIGRSVAAAERDGRSNLYWYKTCNDKPTVKVITKEITKEFYNFVRDNDGAPETIREFRGNKLV